MRAHHVIAVFAGILVGVGVKLTFFAAPTADADSRSISNAANETAIKRVEFGLQLLTAILITFAVGLVLLQLSVRFGLPVDNFDALTF